MSKTFLLIMLSLTFISCKEGVKESADQAKDPTSKSVSDTLPQNGMNVLSEAEKAEGWQLLFDGTSKKGWHIYQGKSEGSAWRVDSGTLVLVPSQKKDGKTVGGGDIITDSIFENYHLSLEWKISPKGNSGIIFNIRDDAKYEWPWETGMEMQILDNDGHPDGKIHKHRAGNLYDLIAGGLESVKPVGEWNKAEVKLYKGNLECWLNGILLVSTTLWDKNWKELVAGSKFRKMPDFGTYRSGNIGLQDHGDTVWFRNIKIRSLQ